MVKDQGQVPRGFTPPALLPVSMETIQVMSEMGELPNLSAMADLYPSMVPGSNFLSWNRCKRKSAMAFRGGGLKST